MPVPELLFMGVSAYVVRANSLTQCEFVLDMNDFDPAHLISVELTKNPNVQAAWAAVQVDAHRDLPPKGLTGIGPDFHRGQHRGAVYLELKYFEQCRSAGKISNWPPAPHRDYQYTSLLRQSASGQHLRFFGYHAHVLKTAGTIANVEIYGTMPGLSKVVRTLWLDLADPQSCDPLAFGHTTVQPVVASAGALFLSWDTIRSLNLLVPKLPAGDADGESLPS